MIQIVPPSGSGELVGLLRRVPVLGARLEVDWRLLQGNETLPYRFYAAGSACVIEITARGAVIAGRPEDEEEAELFLDHMGIDRLTSDGWSPPDWRRSEYDRMRRPPGAPGALPPDPPGLELCPPAEEVIGVLESSDGRIRPEAVREGFYADLCVRRSHGCAAVYGVRSGLVLAATAGSYAVTDTECYIACVETRREYRCLGYAGGLVGALCRAYGDTRPITLMCEPVMQGFYRPMGFAPIPGLAVLAARPKARRKWLRRRD